MPTPMTVQGAAALREELRRRKEKRQEISRAIGAAREHGDLRENAEYHAAREQQGFNEGRIRDIENKLADARVIDISKIQPQGKVVFGATVTLADANSGAGLRYQIVGEDEADSKAGKISIGSPIAQALIGKRVGAEARVRTPKGEVIYEVEAVEHL